MSSNDRIRRSQGIKFVMGMPVHTSAARNIDAICQRHSKYPANFLKDHSRMMFLHDHEYHLYKEDMLKLGWPEDMICSFNMKPEKPDLQSDSQFPTLQELPILDESNFPSLQTQVGSKVDHRLNNYSVTGSSLPLSGMRNARPK